jgi:hypothetical protein
MEEIKKLKVQSIAASNFWEAIPSNITTTWEPVVISNVGSKNKPKQEWDTKFTSRADFNFSM